MDKVTEEHGSKVQSSLDRYSFGHGNLKPPRPNPLPKELPQTSPEMTMPSKGTRTLGDALGNEPGPKFITDEIQGMINTDLAEGQLNGNYHSQTKYNLDGTREIDAWETERCQLVGCNDCEELNTSSKDITRVTDNTFDKGKSEKSAIAKTAEFYNNFENFKNLENSVINQEINDDVRFKPKPLISKNLVTKTDDEFTDLN